MNWTEITVAVANRDTDTAAAIANMTVPYGIYIEDYSDLEQGAEEIAHIDLIDEELVAKDRDTSVIHIYISECDNAAEALEFLKERLTAEGIGYKAEAVGVNDSDWNENWKKYFHATEIGEKLAIVPSWEKYDNKDNRTILQIDPGAAFGTGTHATTSLCLDMLQSYVDDNTEMLDIGCGSGILAVASVLLGAKTAVGVDIDAQSVKTAKENAEINSVTDKTEFIVGDLAEKARGKYSVVCANIVADVVIRLLENVKNYMEADAVLIVSGIIDLRENDVLNAAEKQGFTVIEKRYKDNWCAFALKA
ncbi:MAG: 50S ribosomal protein L11 methyltransferase [Acutalibacteraceae bacterium]|nr:50S ribosomal protein L11 methyltransferase [Acutalibacteraceae bacterium]